jgi:hypothetical protein
MYLYWMSTEDNAEDWFFFAENEEAAELNFSLSEGYEIDQVTAKLLRCIPEGMVIEGEFPTTDQLKVLGGVFLTAEDSLARVVEFDGIKYAEGLMELAVREKDDNVSERLGLGRPNDTPRKTNN